MVDENGKNIPVYDAKPLLDAGKVLFGSADNRRFPIAPGAHVICANKSYTTPTGPGEPVDTWAWAAIALGICENGETQVSHETDLDLTFCSPTVLWKTMDP